MHQSTGVFIAILISSLGTLLLLVGIDRTIGLRLSDEAEDNGMDQSIHGELGYGMLSNS